MGNSNLTTAYLWEKLYLLNNCAHCILTFNSLESKKQTLILSFTAFPVLWDMFFKKRKDNEAMVWFINSISFQHPENHEAEQSVVTFVISVATLLFLFLNVTYCFRHSFFPSPYT